MKIQNLSGELKQMLNEIFSICQNSNGLSDVLDKCILGMSELEQPLKIAIVGTTSSGKSTLLNSLVRRTIVPTGAETLTYNVNVLRHVSRSPKSKECMYVHFKDEHVEVMPISLLSSMVDGRDSSTESLRKNISWVEAYVDFDYLKDIDLIDTPGLLSTKEEDSHNTVDLFNDEIRKPDVFIYLIQRAVLDKDIEAVKQFQISLNNTNSKISGLNTVAALTHCDYFCKGDYSKDFHSMGMKLLESNRTNYASFRSCFCKAFTLAAIFAQTAYAMDDEDFRIIKALGCELYDELTDDLYTRRDFIEDDKVFGKFIQNKDERARFIHRIDIAVIKYAIWWLKNNPSGEFKDLRERLISYSGVRDMDQYVFSNFKRLAIYFKSLKMVSNIRKSIEISNIKFRDKSTLDSLQKVKVLCRNFEVELQRSFSFLSVLVDYYNSSTYFDDEEWEIALGVIDQCLSNNPNIQKLREYELLLQSKLNYFALISDIQAIESCNKLLNQIKLTI